MGIKEVMGVIADALNPLDGIKDTITDIVHSVKGDPQMLKELQLREMEARQRIEQARWEIRVKLEEAWMRDAESLREQIRVELQSEDWFVRRARPGWLWGLLSMYVVNYGVGAVASWFNPGIVPLDIPNEVHLLAGVLVGGYGYLRTLEKRGAKPPLAR
jgi:hypothetical protein